MRPFLSMVIAMLCVLATTPLVPAHAQLPDEAPDIVREYPARALNRPPVDDTTFALARVCMSEADIHRSNDCAAIAEVTRVRAELTGRTLIQQLRAYSPQATGITAPRSLRQGWVSTLRTDLEEPTGWTPMNVDRLERDLLPLRWTSYRSRWGEIIDEARSLLQAPRRVCRESPMHWGGDCNRPRGACDRAPSSWRRVDCCPTVNIFYRVPGVRPQRE